MVAAGASCGGVGSITLMWLPSGNRRHKSTVVGRDAQDYVTKPPATGDPARAARRPPIGRGHWPPYHAAALKAEKAVLSNIAGAHPDPGGIHMPNDNAVIVGLIEKHQHTLLTGWLAAQKRHGRLRDVGNASGNTDQARQFLDLLRRGTATGEFDDITRPEWAPMRELLEDLSRALATEGFTPTETATFVFSIKEPLFDMLRHEFAKNPEALVTQIWA